MTSFLGQVSRYDKRHAKQNRFLQEWYGRAKCLIAHTRNERHLVLFFSRLIKSLANFLER